jgi:hypothetical protein
MDKKYYQVILVIISNDTDDFYCEMMKNYWIPFISYLKKHELSIKIFLLFGQKLKHIEIDADDIIIANTGEGYVPQILEKTIFGLEYINENYDFKHLLRSNLSSFFRSEKILELSSNLRDNRVFTGVSETNGNFASGAGMWFSKDTLLYLIQNKKELQYTIMDDLAIGELLFSKFYKDDITSRQDFDEYNILNNYDPDILKKYNMYHIRIKCSNRFDDAIIMKLLFNYYYKL